MLDFNLPSNAQLEVGHVYTDELVLTNRGDAVQHWSLHLPSRSHRYALALRPLRGQLAPGEAQSIAVRFAFKCTTQINEAVALEVRNVGHAWLVLRHVAALSLVLDPDEIQLSDVAHPIGDGQFASGAIVLCCVALYRLLLLAVYKGVWRSLDVAVKYFKDQVSFFRIYLFFSLY